MDYKDFRESIDLDGFIEDIYVELREDENIVAFIDSHMRGAYMPTMSSRLPLLERFTQIANTYFMEYDLTVSKEQLSAAQAPLGNIVIINVGNLLKNCTQKIRAMSDQDLKTFVEGLGEGKFPLAGYPSTKQAEYPDKMAPYSLWHYRLDHNCQCRDIDFTEFRDGKVRAFIEATGNLKNVSHLNNSLPKIKKRLNVQIKMMSTLSKNFNVPSFIVIHLTDLSFFKVYDLDWNIILEADQAQYIQWLTDL